MNKPISIILIALAVLIGVVIKNLIGSLILTEEEALNAAWAACYSEKRCSQDVKTNGAFWNNMTKTWVVEFYREHTNSSIVYSISPLGLKIRDVLVDNFDERDETISR